VATFALLNCTTYADAYDFTTDTNQISMKVNADEKETTTFGGNGYRSRIGGLKDITADLQGYWQSDVATSVANAPDPAGFSALGVANKVVSISPTGAEASTVFLAQLGEFTYELGDAIGEVLPFTLSMSNSGGQGLIRGQMAKARGNMNATGVAGSVVNLGAPTASQFVYAAFHVFSAGTTITVQVQSDDGAGFGSPTTRATIGPITTAGGTWMTRVAGPFALETHWRLNVSAITGTFNVAGSIAVQ
jgi:hypothetical protein